MTDNESQNETVLPGADRERIEVKEWPNLSLDNFRKWGFDPTEIIHTPRPHFLFSRNRSDLFVSESDEGSFQFEGEFYSVSKAIEIRMLKLVWIFYACIFVLFIAMLISAFIMPLIPAFIFLLMWIVAEGSMNYALRAAGSDSRESKILVNWSSINRMILLSKGGILLLGWKSGKKNFAIAIKLSEEKSLEIFDRLKSLHGDNAFIKKVDGRDLSKPPSDLK
ncbi:MAG: hypothetical protein ABIC40_01890 [bacterium]